ncbi:hypothetical protein D3C87_1935190 [compost metagenome]
MNGFRLYVCRNFLTGWRLFINLCLRFFLRFDLWGHLGFRFGFFLRYHNLPALFSFSRCWFFLWERTFFRKTGACQQDGGEERGEETKRH